MVTVNTKIKKKFRKADHSYEVRKIYSLRDQHLPKLPKNLGHYMIKQNVYAVYLCNIKLRKLPNSLYLVSNLQYLFVSDNCLKKLSEKISFLVNLYCLDLSRNEYIRYLPYSIGNLEKLNYLYIRRLQFQTLPLCFSKLQKLQIYCSYQPYRKKLQIFFVSWLDLF